MREILMKFGDSSKGPVDTKKKSKESKHNSTKKDKKKIKKQKKGEKKKKPEPEERTESEESDVPSKFITAESNTDVFAGLIFTWCNNKLTFFHRLLKSNNLKIARKCGQLGVLPC